MRRSVGFVGGATCIAVAGYAVNQVSTGLQLPVWAWGIVAVAAGAIGARLAAPQGEASHASEPPKHEQLRVDVSNHFPVFDRADGSQTMGDPLVAVIARNGTARPVRATGWGARGADGRTLIVTQPTTRWEPPLPHWIAAGDEATWYLDAADVRQRAESEGWAFEDMIAFVTFADGREVTADRGLPLSKGDSTFTWPSSGNQAGTHEPVPAFPPALPGWQLTAAWTQTTRAFTGQWRPLAGPGGEENYPATMNGCDQQRFLLRYRVLNESTTVIPGWTHSPPANNPAAPEQTLTPAHSGWLALDGCQVPMFTFDATNASSANLVDVAVEVQRYTAAV